MRYLTCGSLFAGIGGFDLGFERAGIKTIWQVEIDQFCRRVLERHFPDADRSICDVREASPKRLPWVNVLAGGFPCQDISEAGKRAGIDGERSGLWSEYLRAIGEFRPEFAVVENVTALLNRGIERVLGDLADIGYDAEWSVVGADALGATQHRCRIWILAYPSNAGFQGPIWAGKPCPPRKEWAAAYSEPLRSDCGFWPPGPGEVADIPRMADGPANRVDRLKSLGNAVVPQIAEWIGQRIKLVAAASLVISFLATPSPAASSPARPSDAASVRKGVGLHTSDARLQGSGRGRRMRTVAALCVRRDSIYKALPGVDARDEDRERGQDEPPRGFLSLLGCKKKEKQMKTGQFVRQGDVFITRVSDIPAGERKPKTDGCLAYGEVTGHAHRVSSLADAALFHVGENAYLSVSEAGVSIVHEEHSPITLPPGSYQVTIQREYSPEAIRNVAD